MKKPHHSKSFMLNRILIFLSYLLRGYPAEKRTENLRAIALFIMVMTGCIGYLSYRLRWEPPRFGILVWGHRTEVIFVLVGLILLSLTFWFSSIRSYKRMTTAIASFFLSLSSLAFCLAISEGYLNYPKNSALLYPDEIAAIENNYSEDGICFRQKPGRKVITSTVPYNNIPWFKKNRDSAKQEFHKVRNVFDRLGFCNTSVPSKVDILAVGDSFTMGADVDYRENWLAYLSNESGWSVYNLGVGGIGTSQELALYRKYESVCHPSCVLLSIFSINDLFDEMQYSEYLKSGMTLKEWGLSSSWVYLP